MKGPGSTALRTPRSGRFPGAARLALVACCAAFAIPAAGTSQTISGRLLDLETDLPVPVGLVMMFTESGDSVTATLSDGSGQFSLSAPTAGSFVLRAVALGYRETPAGVFELGEDASLTVEYRLPPQPLAIDAVLVSLDRPTTMHHLVRNGFVSRFQRGLGVFITPYEIERSSAMSTEQLMQGVPGVRVGTVVTRAAGVGLPRPEIGETIQIRSSSGGWCVPTVYLDGSRFAYNAGTGFTLSMVADLETVEAIEIYRRPAEIPVEYAAGPFSDCGVLVVWTKSGLGPGQRPSRAADGVEGTSLPTVDEHGPPPEPGERIRMQLDAEASVALGLEPTWEGTFLMVQDDEIVATDPVIGRAIAVPLSGVEVLQVSRERAPHRAVVRGLLAGAAIGLGTWAGLSMLCSWSACHDAVENPLLPAVITGLFVGGAVTTQGPGRHWIGAAMPELARPRQQPGVGLSLRVPWGGW
jgi:hypothetical protein